MEVPNEASEKTDRFETDYKITGVQFMELFKYTFLQHFDFSIIVAKDGENKWTIYPLTAFQEATLLYNIASTKKDPDSIQDALNVLTDVRMMLRGKNRHFADMRTTLHQ